MKISFSILVCTFLLVAIGGNAQPVSVPPKYILFDDCETVYTSNWPTPKNQGYYMFSGQDCPSSSTITRVSSGQFGAPAPRNGTYSYRMKVVKNPAMYGNLACTRSETYWGDGSDPTPYDHRWTAYSTYIPTNWCDEARPTGIGMDHKKISTAGSPNFRLEAFNGRYRVVTNIGAGETTYDLGPITKGVWVDWVYYNNYQQGAAGVLQFYKNGVMVLNRSGVTAFDFEGGSTNRESYMLHGIYKWVWDNADGQGWGGGTCNDSAVMYIDRVRYGTSQATLADFTGTETPGNIAPSAYAGVNQTVTLPMNFVTLSASGSSDADGTIASYAWTKVSGTGGTIASPSSSSTNVTGLVQGTYVFRLTVTDDDGATGTDDVTVNVLPETPAGADNPFFTDVSNNPAAVPNVTVLLPATSTTFTFYADDTDPGIAAQMNLIQIGTTPNVATITLEEQNGDNPTFLRVNVSGLVAGTYTMRASVLDDDDGITVYDTFNIFVVAESNDPPTAYGGADQILALDQGTGGPTTISTNLTGTAGDPDGSVQGVLWSKIGGPEAGIFGSPTSNNTTFDGLVPGVYTVRFTVTDNQATSAFDQTIITVLGTDAGAQQSILYPGASSVTLSGSTINVTDTASVLWTKVSGTGGTITTPASLSTTVTGLTPGNYLYELAVTYNSGHITRDRVQISVLTTVSTGPLKVRGVKQ
jgi:hypothetical protein